MPFEAASASLTLLLLLSSSCEDSSFLKIQKIADNLICCGYCLGTGA